ncbi:MAG: hypothetical protein RLZZ116_1477 [Planctomycetota bacterium]
MKTWNTLGTVRSAGIAAVTASMSLATSVAMAGGSITIEAYSGPVSGGPAPESILVADFEGDLPVGLSFLPPAPAIVKGNSVAPGTRSLQLGQWDPFEVAATQILFDAEVLGGIAPRFAGFVVTESAGLGMPAPITVTVWYDNGTSQTANFDVLSQGSESADDMLIRVDSKLGITQITVASVIPISIDNVMYESNAETLPDRYVQDDVNGDGKSDSAWFRTRRFADDTSISSVWLWGNTSYTNLSPSLVAPANRARMVGIGDFDGDKRADLLWNDTRSGALWVWRMTALGTTQQLIDRTTTGGWAVVGFNDVNGDKRADIVMRRIVGASTELRLVALNGATVISDITTSLVGQYNAAYVGDLDRDGRADLLIKQRRAANCATETYFTTSLEGDVAGVGGAFSAPARLRDAANKFEAPLDRRYTIVGLADLSNDGSSDIVFRHTSGDIVVWDMDDAKVTSKAVLAQRAAGFTVVGFPDVDGNGSREIMLRNGKADVKTWKVSGSAVIESTHGKQARVYAPAAPAK